MASVRVRRETGLLMLDFRVNGVRCREQTKLPDSPANRKRLTQLLERISAEIVLGMFEYERYFPGSPNGRRVRTNTQPGILDRGQAQAPPEETRTESTPLFQAFGEIWYAENDVRWRRTTKGHMRMILTRYLYPEFGARRLSEVTRADVLAFRATFAKRPGKSPGTQISPKTVNDVVGTLKAVIDEAAARYGFGSPCTNLRRLKVPRSEVFPFTLDEVWQLIHAVRPDYRSYLTLRAFTGLRTGEANGLRWEHLDFARREILIRETFTHGERDRCKTDGSWREVIMSQPVFEALNAHRAQRSGSSPYVFSNSQGEPLDNKNFCARVWYPLLRRLGLKQRRPYQLRHTCATLWLAAGENPAWIARQLGHSSVEMLFRTYARWCKNMTQRDGASFEALLADTSAQREDPC